MISFKKFKKAYTNDPENYIYILNKYLDLLKDPKIFLKNIFPINIFSILIYLNSIFLFLYTTGYIPVVFYTNLLYLHGIIIMYNLFFILYYFMSIYPDNEESYEAVPSIVMTILVSMVIIVFSSGFYITRYISILPSQYCTTLVSIQHVLILATLYISITVLTLVYLKHRKKYKYYYKIYTLLKKDLSILQYPSYTVWNIYNDLYTKNLFYVNTKDLHILYLFINKNKILQHKDTLYYKNKAIILY